MTSALFPWVVVSNFDCFARIPELHKSAQHATVFAVDPFRYAGS